MNILSHCPTCNEKLSAKVLSCTRCGLELVNSFEFSAFDYLEEEDFSFLISFLKAKGNFSVLQNDLGISYPTAKKRLNRLLRNLGISDEADEEVLNMKTISKEAGTSASAIVKNKLIDAGGSATIHTYNGIPHRICITKDGMGFLCDAFANMKHDFSIFDCVVDLLLREGGRAKKGLARGKNDKVGSENCDEHTVTGIIALEYYKKSVGDSVFDSAFIVIGILEWAGIVDNCRGYIKLRTPK